MAQRKRPAEKALTSSARRQRITKDKEPTSESQYHSYEDDEPEECRIDSQPVTIADEKLAVNFAERLTAVNLHADQRKIWAKDFEKEVMARKTIMTKKIEDAKLQLEDKREVFKRSILPVLSAALQDSSHGSTISPAVQLPLKIKIAHTTEMVTEASLLLKNCQTIIACYEELAEADLAPSSIVKLREIFAKDKKALEVAFTGARKMVSNHIQAQTLSERGKHQERLSLNEEEESFGRKVLKNSKMAQGTDLRNEIILSDVCRNLGKAVGKIQHVIEM